MLTLVEARNSHGSLLSLPLDDISGGYSVEPIQGLGPVKATIVSSSFAGVDGTQFQSARREERNIILALGLQPDYVTTSVEDLRLKLYTFFMPKSKVSLRFYKASGLIVNIMGYVETCEPDIFTDEPTVNVSIICNDSDFIEIDSEVLSAETTSDTTVELIEYAGTVEVGVEIALSVDRDLTEFTIYHTPPDSNLTTMDFSIALEDGDLLKISTVVRNKFITLTRAGVTTSVLYAKSPQSGWMELLNGDNYIRIYAVGDPIPYTLTYVPRHGGL